MIEIKLTSSEWVVAGVVGSLRRVASMQNANDKNKHAEKSDWATDADGAAAEIAAAKHFGYYWEPAVNTFKKPDLPNQTQVRSTNHHDGHLIVRRNDNAAHTFVLGIVDHPFVRLIGTILGAEAMRDEFWRVDSWWVPQERLHPLLSPSRKAAA